VGSIAPMFEPASFNSILPEGWSFMIELQPHQQRAIAEKPAYIARQMGHKNAQMLFKVYAKWIDGADQGREAKALSSAQRLA